VSVLPACWVDGKRVDPASAHILVTDRGFTLADGIFETMRAYGGTIFRLNDHMARLSRGAERLGLPRPAHLAETLSTAMRELRDARADAVVRLTVSRGPGRHGLAPTRGESPTVVLTAQELTVFKTSIGVRTASGRRNEYAMSAGIKTLSYTDNVLALLEATAKGGEDAIFLDTGGHVSEATASNVFLVKNDAVHTPPLSCGAFPGITRAVVIELLDGLDVEVTHDEPVTPAELAEADEVFLTSSIREIAPVDTIDGRTLAAPGPVTTAVMGAFAAHVQVERES
jgi:branched-chain amino acid aminotransferase